MKFYVLFPIIAHYRPVLIILDSITKALEVYLIYVIIICSLLEEVLIAELGHNTTVLECMFV